jgi:hypothetical protein
MFQGGDPLKRNENDAAALTAKIAAKQAAKEAGNGDGSSAGRADVGATKKTQVSSKAGNVDDLLLAGLAAAKRVK